MRKVLQMEQVLHKNKLRLFLKFSYDAELIRLVKTFPCARWSRSQKAWHISYSEERPGQVMDMFTQKNISIHYLNASTKLQEPLRSSDNKPIHKLGDLPLGADEKIKTFKRWMRSKRYSESTISTYCDALNTFLRFHSGKDLKEISNIDIINFNNDYILANHFSSSFQNQVINAIKLFFRTTENKQLEPEYIHRPRREKLLPNVLNREEVKLILNASGNVKHKTMLSLIYSCGLRCGELLQLRPADIDSKRKLILIKQAKGKKDRIVPLSDKILDLLRQYWKTYKPKNYLFEGQHEGEMYDSRSLQQVLKTSLLKAKIKKPVTLHWLRHSYATHLLENGTDLRYIQEILGHSRSTTTEIYTHVSSRAIQNVISPFDTL